MTSHQKKGLHTKKRLTYNVLLVTPCLLITTFDFLRHGPTRRNRTLKMLEFSLEPPPSSTASPRLLIRLQGRPWSLNLQSEEPCTNTHIRTRKATYAHRVSDKAPQHVHKVCCTSCIRINWLATAGYAQRFNNTEAKKNTFMTPGTLRTTPAGTRPEAGHRPVQWITKLSKG